MKKLICCFLMMIAFTNAFASTMAIGNNQKKAVKMELADVESMVVANCDDGSKELQVKTTADHDDAFIDMKNVGSIKFLAGKNPDDKVSFYVNGSKRTYKLSEIKSIQVRTIERAN